MGGRSRPRQFKPAPTWSPLVSPPFLRRRAVGTDVDVVVYGPLRAATGAREVEVPYDGGTVADAVEALVEAYPRASAQLYADDGTLRPSVRVMREGERVDLEAPCGPDDELSIIPAAQGG